MSNPFPTIKPSLLLDFGNTKRLDPRITFTRASNSGGYYDGVTTAKAEENLLLRSQEFDNAYWDAASFGATISANSTIAPNGTTTADTLTENTANSTHLLRQASLSTSFVNGTTYTQSWHVKANGRDKVRISFSDSSFPGAARTADFDLTAVTATPNGGGTATISSLGNGWYRCAYTQTADLTDSANYSGLIQLLDSGGNGTYTGDGTSGVFLWGAQLEARSSVTAYTATTTQPITNYIPKMLFAADGVPVFYHSPTTGESLGLGIWESRTNLLTYSQDFSNAAWTKTATTVSTNSNIAPDGTLTASTLTTTAATGSFSVSRGAGFSTGSYTSSIYAKKGTHNFVQFSPNSAATIYANFDLDSGAVGTSANCTATIVSVGNGWYRLTVVYTAAATINSAPVWFIVTSGSAVRAESWTATGYETVFIWGAVVEAGTFATPYIPTVASQVTRAADSASMTGTNFSSWYNQAEGTLFFSGAKAGGSVSFPIPVIISDGTDNNRLQFYLNNSTNRYAAFTVAGGTTQADVSPTGTPAAGATFNIAAGFEANYVQCALDAVLGTADTVGVMPLGVNQLGIGNRTYSTAQVWNGYIRKLAYYPLRISDTALQALTR